MCPPSDRSSTTNVALRPFHVSRSKRIQNLRPKEMYPEDPNRAVVYHGLMKALITDAHFNWKTVMDQSNQDVQDPSIGSKAYGTNQNTFNVVPLSWTMLSRLGIAVLPNRRLCIDGRALKGIFLPESRTQQTLLIVKFLVWFSPCIELKDNVYRMNEHCFDRRENYFLRMYLRSLGYLHHLWNPFYSDHFFKRPI